MALVLTTTPALAAVDSLTGSEIIAVVQNNVDKRTTVAGITAASEVATVTNKGTITSGTVTFNRGTGGPKQKLTVGGNLTIAFTNWAASGTYSEMEIELVNGGAHTITWPTVKWLLGDGSNSTTFADMSVSLEAADTNWVIIWTTTGGSTLWGKAT